MTPYFKAFLALAACAVVFLLSGKANAQENGSINLVGVGVHIGSHHWPTNEWNNRNPGVYVIGRYNGPGILAGEYAVGTFYNSERKQSTYIVRNFSVLDHLDLSVGLISGYKRAPIIPMVSPSVRLALDRGYIMRISAIPKVGSMPWVAHLSLEKRF